MIAGLHGVESETRQPVRRLKCTVQFAQIWKANVDPNDVSVMAAQWGQDVQPS